MTVKSNHGLMIKNLMVIFYKKVITLWLNNYQMGHSTNGNS